MSRLRILALAILITFALGILAVGDALAGEKFKIRTIKHMVKWEKIDVGDQEGHYVSVGEAKGIAINTEGKWFADGWLHHWAGLSDTNPKAGLIVVHGYEQRTDPDGDKVCHRYQGKQIREDYYEGTFTILNGTGKFEGIRGKGTWTVNVVAPGQWYSDEEWDIDLPRR